MASSSDSTMSRSRSLVPCPWAVHAPDACLGLGSWAGSGTDDSHPDDHSGSHAHNHAGTAVGGGSIKTLSADEITGGGVARHERVAGTDDVVVCFGHHIAATVRLVTGPAGGRRRAGHDVATDAVLMLATSGPFSVRSARTSRWRGPAARW